MTFAVKERVNFSEIDNKKVIKAVEVHPYAILPSQEVYDIVKKRMVHLVKRVYIYMQLIIHTGYSSYLQCVNKGSSLVWIMRCVSVMELVYILLITETHVPNSGHVCVCLCVCVCVCVCACVYVCVCLPVPSHPLCLCLFLSLYSIPLHHPLPLGFS